MTARNNAPAHVTRGESLSSATSRHPMAPSDGEHFPAPRRSPGGTPGSVQVSAPAKPSAAMLALGAEAGGVSVEVAWRIYRAMIDANR